MGSKYLYTALAIFLGGPVLASTQSTAQPTTAASTQSANVSYIPSFQAKYNIVHDGDIIGKAKRELINHSDGSVEFNYKTDIKRLIFSDHRQEITTNKIIDGNVIPLSYQSSREGTGKDKFYNWSFNKDMQQVTNLVSNDTKTIDWPDGFKSC